MPPTTAPRTEAALFRDYALTGFDEMFAGPGHVRPHYRPLHARLGEIPPRELERRGRLADGMMRQQGITFTVYGRGSSTERIMPFDPIPRIVPADEWSRIEKGLQQRVRALNLFVHDVYHARHILRDGAVPADLVFGSAGYRREMNGIAVPHNIYLARQRHRSDSRRRRPLPCARRQLPHAVGRELCAEEPRGDEAGVSVAVRGLFRAAGRRLRGRPAGRPCGTPPRPASPSRRSSSSRRGRSTRRITNTPSSRGRWGCRW